MLSITPSMSRNQLEHTLVQTTFPGSYFSKPLFS